jgi:hypothetical protein
MATYMNGPTGMNTSSESPEPSRLEANVPGDESELSSYEIEGLLTLAIMALRQVTEAVYKAHAREAFRPWNLEAAMTREPEPASLFTQRLTHFYGLLGTQLEELRSIAPTGPVTAATDSSREQESPASSRLARAPFCRTDKMEELDRSADEPPCGTVLMDDSSDVWQRQYEGWCCAIQGATYQNWDWAKLTACYPRLRVLYRAS